MRREFISRLTRNRFKSNKELRNLFEAEKSDRRKRARQDAAASELKGVHKGNFYRIRVPGPPPPSPVTKLLNPSSPPVKKFSPVESSSSAHAHPHPHHQKGGTAKKNTTQSTLLSELRQASQEERREFFQFYWKRVKEWFKLNWPVLILNFGSICTLAGFTRSDVVELRTLSVTGSLSSVVYFAAQPAANRSLTPILWSLTFASVNGFKIYQILVERKANVDLPQDQLDVYRRQFEPHGITPKQFEYIMKKAETIRLKKGEVLIREGDPLRHVYLITAGHTRAHHLGRRLTAVSYAHEPTKTNETHIPTPAKGASGAWVGEMAFFEKAWQKGDGSGTPANINNKGVKTGNTQNTEERLPKETHNGEPEPLATTERAMYTIVALEDDTTVLAWSHADMQSLMNRSSDMRAALSRAMTAAIVSKVVGFTMSRKATGEGPVGWIGRLWPGATQGPVEPVEPTGGSLPVEPGGPLKVTVPVKPVFTLPENR